MSESVGFRTGDVLGLSELVTPLILFCVGVALVYGIIVLLKKKGVIRPASDFEAAIKIEERKVLGGGETLYLVSVRGQEYVLLAGKNGAAISKHETKAVDQ